MTAYALPEDVALMLGVTLTGDQEFAAALALDAATALIDQALGQSWLTAGTVTGEFYSWVGDRLYLRHRPVTSITSLVRTGPSVTNADQTLVANTDYKLWDAQQGLVLLTYGWGPGYAIRATYVHTESVPADIVQLATLIAAGMVRQTVNPDMAGVKRYTLWGGDLSVEFTDDAANPVISTQFNAVLARRRIPVIA